ncbi:MAG: ammonium transporter [Candidatus Hydrogenedentes bacterium]|nr:ammonium transporter [Candidatus Hydrogenedentota bacterium]
MPGVALAQDEAPTLDSGNTAWMLTATALVLFMTIPGLSLFYAGLVRRKNVLSVLMQCFALTALGTILWVGVGYSLAFNTTGMEAGMTNLNSFVGGFDDVMLRTLKRDALSGTYPTSVFIMFQMTFFIITPALICGAYAERMKFSSMMIFSTLWLLLSYAPICHMAWSGPGALFNTWGVMDFAGGTVVHINAGIAALMACIILGKRAGFPEKAMPPHNLTMAVTGAGMLWVGWFGFNAGSEFAADGIAGMAMLVTQIATGMATLTWMAAEWIKNGKPSVLGAVTGAVAGLVAITPASGTAGPMGAMIIGVAVGIICFFSATSLKRALGYDDSLDAFGVHGVGGVVGALLTGVCASTALGGVGYAEGVTMGAQVFAQLKSVLVTLVWSGAVSAVILLALKATIGIRVSEEQESQGLDITQHEEEGYYL